MTADFIFLKTQKYFGDKNDPSPNSNSESKNSFAFDSYMADQDPSTKDQTKRVDKTKKGLKPERYYKSTCPFGQTVTFTPWNPPSPWDIVIHLPPVNDSEWDEEFGDQEVEVKK